MESPNSHSKKKRKIDDDDEGEEAKMEKFFALVRSLRETRSFLINFESGTCKGAENKNKRNQNGADGEKNKALVWMPTFQLEDFVEEEAKRQVNPTLGSAGASHSHSKESANKEEEAEKGIDLRLSL